MRTGVYGGTFNPVHLGHLRLIEEMSGRIPLDRVLIIPTNIPPHKISETLADGADRLRMCELACKDIENVAAEVSDIELSRPGKSYTADTLIRLAELYPSDEFYLLMGEDMFLTVDRWAHAEEIMRLAVLCACPRGGSLERLRDKQTELSKNYSARCIIETFEFFPVSSTQIRERLRRGEPITGLVPKSVEAYILERGLYHQRGREL